MVFFQKEEAKKPQFLAGIIVAVTMKKSQNVTSISGSSFNYIGNLGI